MNNGLVSQLLDYGWSLDTYQNEGETTLCFDNLAIVVGTESVYFRFRGFGILQGTSNATVESLLRGALRIIHLEMWNEDPDDIEIWQIAESNILDAYANFKNYSLRNHHESLLN